MQKYSLYFGTEFDADGKRIAPDVQNVLLSKIRRLAVNVFNGYTLNFARGGYRMADGNIVEESTVILDIFANDAERVRTFAAIVRADLSQESVCMVDPSQTVHFIEE